jgi:hypothetical protein
MFIHFKPLPNIFDRTAPAPRRIGRFRDQQELTYLTSKTPYTMGDQLDRNPHGGGGDRNGGGGGEDRGYTDWDILVQRGGACGPSPFVRCVRQGNARLFSLPLLRFFQLIRAATQEMSSTMIWFLEGFWSGY